MREGKEQLEMRRDVSNGERGKEEETSGVEEAVWSVDERGE